MTEETQKKELISIEEVVNWILLLVIFSVLVSIGSYVGYHQSFQFLFQLVVM